MKKETKRLSLQERVRYIRVFVQVRISPKRAVLDRYRTCRGFLVLPVVDAGLRHFPDQRNQETSVCLRIFFQTSSTSEPLFRCKRD